MLHWIWLIALTGFGWVMAYVCWSRKSGEDGGTPQLMSHAAMLMSIVMSWDEVGAKVFQWLLASLPHQGTEINMITSAFIGLLLGLLWIAHPVFSGLLCMNDDGEVALKNFSIRRVIAAVITK